MSAVLKILHAYKVYSPVEGGVPTFMKFLAERLLPQVQSAVLCTGSQLLDRSEIINGVTVHRLASLGNLLSLPLSLHYPFKLWSLARQVDIVDYHFPMPWVDVAAAIYFPPETRLVIHWHSEIIEQKLAAKCLSPLIERCLQRADRIVVADNSYVKRSPFLSRFADKCVAIPFGIDVEKFHAISAEEQQKINALRTKYPRLILGVGRLVSYKGFNVLIDAMQKINGQLIIVGQGSLEAELKNQVRSLGLEDKVHFYGRADDSELKCLYHASQLFAFPSVTTNEAFGLVQLEAMSCGKPVVNTQLDSAVPEVARHGKEALTVPPGAVQPLADAVNQLLNNPELAQQLGQQGYERAVSHYSFAAMLEQTLQLYQNLKKT